MSAAKRGATESTPGAAGVPAMLEPRGPLGTVDLAWAVMRRLGTGWVLSVWAAAGPLALLPVAWAHVESGLGLVLPRWLLAGLLVAAWLWRVRGAASAAHRAARLVWPGQPAAEGPPGWRRVGYEASWTGLALLVGLAPAVLGYWLAGTTGLLVGSFVLPLRGTWGPAWLATLGAPPAERSARRTAWRLQRGRRWHGLLVELLLHGAWLLLAVDLLLLLAFGGPLLRGVFGARVALEPVVRLTHPVVQLAAAAGAALLLEPVRVARSALAFTEGAARREGLDVRLRLEAAVGQTLLAALLLLGAPRVLEAQSTYRPSAEAPRSVTSSMPQGAQVATPPAPVGPGAVPDADDQRVQQLAEEVLAAPDFREAARRPPGSTLRRSFESWLLRLWTEWLRSQRERDDGWRIPLASVDLRWAAVFLLVLLVVATVVWLLRRRRAGEAPVDGEPGAEEDGGRAGRPEPWRRRVERLLDEGRFVEAVRLLLWVLLEGLDRAGRLRFEPHLPNGVYLRRAVGPEREVLAEAVALFDHTYYGGEAPPGERIRQVLHGVEDLLDDLGVEAVGRMPHGAAGRGT